MNILMLHGYLLEGSGSNVYVQNLVRAFCKMGHNVYLFCQERKLKKYDFVKSHSFFDSSNKRISTTFKKRTPFRGKCHVLNPHIGKLIPVYVKDKYDNFSSVKEFPNLTKKELHDYIKHNAQALKTFLKHTRINKAFANHVIMSPYIAAQGLKDKKIPFTILCHGSAFNYSVKQHPHLRPYAVKAITSAQAVSSPSQYFNALLIKELAKSVPSLKRKARVLACGVDIHQFKPVYHIRSSHINSLSHVLKVKIKGQKGHSPYQLDKDVLKSIKNISWGKDRIITYVGKFMHISSRSPPF